MNSYDRKILLLNFISLFISVSELCLHRPRTGSIILQALIGALAAATVFIKIYWHKLLVFLGIRKKTESDNKQNLDNKKDS